jgi:hypothetical protein
MRPHLEAWRAAADALRGSLRLADCCLELTRDEIELRIRCDFDDEGQLRGTILEMSPKVSIPSRDHLLWIGEGDPPEHPLPLAALARAPSWAASAASAASGTPAGPPASVEVDAEAVRVFLPAPLPDPLEERERIEQLFAAGRQLRGERGPYR